MDPVSFFFGANRLPYNIGIVLGYLHDLFYTLFAASLTMDNSTLFWSCIVMKTILIIIVGIIMVKRIRQEIKLEKQD